MAATPAADGDWKSNLQALVGTRRACLLVIKNQTDKRFVKIGENLNHGRFAADPPAQIEPKAIAEFGAEGRTALTGTQGSVQYEIAGADVTFLIYWYNPKVGKPKVGFAVPAPYTCHRSGKLDKFSEIVFEIGEQQPEATMETDRTGDEEPASLDHSVHDSIAKYYTISQTVLGSGTFSTVKVGTDKRNGRKVAIKIVDKKRSKKVNLEREVGILRLVHHVNVTELLDLFESETYLYIVMELVDGCELFEQIMQYKNKGKLCPENWASRMMSQCIEAIAYLHERNIVHRDIKPENLLMTKQGVIKLTDFGLSSLYSPASLMLTCCGTPDYVAPEVLKCEPSGYYFQADMWSLGVVLFFMLCGHLPFDDANQDNLFESIMRGSYEMKQDAWQRVSAEAKDLVQRLLQVEPDKRLTAKAALQHPWITMHAKAHADNTPPQL